MMIPRLTILLLYFQCIDAAISTISHRFQQKDYSMYANMEQLLVKTCMKMDYSEEYKTVTQFYGSDFCEPDLKTQLEVLGSMEINIHKNSLTFSDIHRHFQSMPSSQVLYLNQVASVVILVRVHSGITSACEHTVVILVRVHSDITSMFVHTVVILVRVHSDITSMCAQW